MKNQTLFNVKLAVLAVSLVLMMTGFIWGSQLTMDNPIKHACVYMIMAGEILMLLSLPSIYFHPEN